jgi:hypothetical protein
MPYKNMVFGAAGAVNCSKKKTTMFFIAALPVILDGQAVQHISCDRPKPLVHTDEEQIGSFR